MSWHLFSDVFRKIHRDVVILHPQKDVHRKMRKCTAAKPSTKGIQGKKKEEKKGKENVVLGRCIQRE